MTNLEIFRLLLISCVLIVFVYAMITKRISTLIALPIMGVLTAVIASVGEVPMLGLFAHENAKGEEVQGIMNSVLGDGARMMASTIAATIFGGAFAVLLRRVGVAEAIIKKAAELAGDRVRVIAFIFYVATMIIFTAIGGLGAVILVGSVALPIMMTAGISGVVSGSIILLGLTTGGVMNPAGFAFFATILEPVIEGGYEAAYEIVARMAITLFIISFIVSVIYILLNVKNNQRSAWHARKTQSAYELSNWALLSPIVPVLLVLSSIYVMPQVVTAELAIIAGIIYTVYVCKIKDKINAIAQSFVQGTQEVAGAIVLLIGLGILIRGVQFYTVTPIIAPAIEMLVSMLQSPMTYVIGFTLATPLVLYRGPLNSWGIGGSLPAIFATAGFSPIAVVWVLRSTGMMQGFGDPTNSQNIWIADFVQADPNDITKSLFWVGLVITFIALGYAILVDQIPLI
ncbi:transporter [Vibrio sp. Isolate25]|uniref:transporter n=1 Tax=Vibrio TaxID=662 RepID=UPI001EFE78CD|nr:MULTISPECIES: transporter [Vibrio]MCG9597100.1 transporter [Vibrio sp. Isolate25]MCG9678378.1 transporter [Vibrio sp. Isolate24]USD31678.1 transporter [Vibrio sp. SCSIO 43186]USD44722.1 transporter [Vibrio sp. SCSIO 43145]USD68801.1 transporter [Vibrio sp. SCSIO 43139]